MHGLAWVYPVNCCWKRKIFETQVFEVLTFERGSSAGDAGRQLWREVFDLACQDYQAGRGKSCHALSVRGKRRIRVWQAVCSLVSFAPVPETEQILRRVFETLQVSNFAPALDPDAKVWMYLVFLRYDTLILGP